MPIPKPKPDDTEEEFISRCMGNPTMVDDYPDQNVRAGICYTQWRNRKKDMNKTITIPLEIKALNKREFEGYGSIFGNKDWGNDVVMPGAFSQTLAEHKNENTLPMMFWMHDPSRIPGKWLTMTEDDRGLYVKGILADTPLGNEIHTLLGMKAVSGLSIGYIATETDYNNDGVRLIKSAELLETSIVSIPMNPKAQIAHMKSRLSERGEYVPTDDELAHLKRECEQFFKTKGFSKSLAKQYVSNLFKAGAMLDEPDEKSVPEGKKQSDETPDEIEIREGLTRFKESEMVYELNKRLKEIF